MEPTSPRDEARDDEELAGDEQFPEGDEQIHVEEDGQIPAWEGDWEGDGQIPEGYAQSLNSERREVEVNVQHVTRHTRAHPREECALPPHPSTTTVPLTLIGSPQHVPEQRLHQRVRAANGHLCTI